MTTQRKYAAGTTVPAERDALAEKVEDQDWLNWSHLIAWFDGVLWIVSEQDEMGPTKQVAAAADYWSAIHEARQMIEKEGTSDER